MTTTELETDGSRLSSWEPLSEFQAQALDKRIRAASDKVADNMDTLVVLLREAMNGQIHVALGLPSWTAYVKDAVQIVPADKVERKALVAIMSGKGMSQRAIAGTLGASQATVSRDLESSDTDESVTTTGLNGNTYKRKNKEEPIDAEVIDELTEEETAKPRSVSEEFTDEMGYLANSVSSFRDILDDERFPKAAKAIAKQHLNDLQLYMSELQTLIDALMGLAP